MAEVPVWVLDTNVLVSGLLSPFGPPGRLVDALLARRLRLAFDDRIELEYREILARPGFGIARAWQDAFFATMQFQEHVTALPWLHRDPPDADDVIFLEVATQISSRTLVTGNLKHFPSNCRGPVTVQSPRVAWEHFRRLSSV